MIIDSHTHIGFGYPLKASVRELISSMKRAKIGKALVFAGEINHCSTEKLLIEVKNYSKFLYPIGSVSPLSPKKPTLKQVEKWLKNNQIYGLKFYPGYEPFYPYDATLRPYLRLLVKYNRPAIFHSGDTYNLVPNAKLKYAHPFEFDELAVELPNLKIVIAHLGNPWVVDTAEVCFKNKNVYADCSGFVYGNFGDRNNQIFKQVFKKLLADFMTYTLGKNKLLFGTDWPISDQKSYVLTVRPLLGKDKERIFSQNTLKVFGITA